MNSDNTTDTKQVLDHHLKALFDESVDDILADYTDESVLYQPSGPVRGLAGLRDFFTEFMAHKPAGFPEHFELLRQDVKGDLAYIVWRNGTSVPLATDTFLVRDKKILIQTFVAFMPS